MKRTAIAVLGLALSLIGSGCRVWYAAARNLAYEAHLNSDSRWENREDAEQARHAWRACHRDDPHGSRQPDYACGFKDGFADYLRAGGNGQPPPLPPRRYWHAKYRTPTGHQAVEAWYAGFSEGVAAAKNSGLRRWRVVSLHAGPVGPPKLTPGGPPLVPPAGPFAPFPFPHAERPDALETLPAPRPLPGPIEKAPAAQGYSAMPVTPRTNVQGPVLPPPQGVPGSAAIEE